MMGEPRHRRSHLYDVATGARTRLFANNTIRTISPEYIWVPSADGSRAADPGRSRRRHGLRRARRLRRRSDAQGHGRRRARAPGSAARRRERPARADDEGVSSRSPSSRRRSSTARQSTASTTTRRRCSTSTRSTSRSRATCKAIDYLEKTYRSFGYDPQIQWFTPQQLQATGGRTANVVATLKGTENPELDLRRQQPLRLGRRRARRRRRHVGHGGAARGGADSCAAIRCR